LHVKFACFESIIYTNGTSYCIFEHQAVQILAIFDCFIQIYRQKSSLYNTPLHFPGSAGLHSLPPPAVPGSNCYRLYATNPMRHWFKRMGFLLSADYVYNVHI